MAIRTTCPSAKDIMDDNVDDIALVVNGNTDKIYTSWDDLVNSGDNITDGDEVEVWKKVGSKTARNQELTLED